MTRVRMPNHDRDKPAYKKLNKTMEVNSQAN